MAVNRITNRQTVNKESINRANQVSTKNKTIRGNRQTTIVPGNNFSQNYSITLKDVDTSVLNHIKNMAAILHKQDIAIRNINGDIVISILEKKDASSSTFDLVLGSNNVSGNFCMYFKEEYLKIMKGRYDVEISSEAISYFRHQDLPLEYWIALEPDSYYDEEK